MDHFFNNFTLALKLLTGLTSLCEVKILLPILKDAIFYSFCCLPLISEPLRSKIHKTLNKKLKGRLRPVTAHVTIFIITDTGLDTGGPVYCGLLKADFGFYFL